VSQPTTLPRATSEGIEETKKSSVTVTDVLVKIRIKHVSNKSL
jgi:hypothetical protein